MVASIHTSRIVLNVRQRSIPRVTASSLHVDQSICSCLCAFDNWFHHVAIQDCSCLVATSSWVFYQSISCGFTRPRPQVLHVRPPHILLQELMWLMDSICRHHMSSTSPPCCWYQLFASVSIQVHLSKVGQSHLQIHCLSANFFILFYGYLSHVDLANHHHCWCDYALLVLFVAILQHTVVHGSLFVVITIRSYCLQSCSSDLHILSLVWFDYLSILVGFKVSKAKVHIWRVELLFVKIWGIYLSTGCEGSTLLWIRSFCTWTLFKSCTLQRHLQFWMY